MVLKRKKSYKPKGGEREGEGGDSRSYIDFMNMMMSHWDTSE